MERSSHFHLGPNQPLIKSFNINTEVADLIFSAIEFRKCGPRALRLLSPYFVVFEFCTKMSCLLWVL